MEKSHEIPQVKDVQDKSFVYRRVREIALVLSLGIGGQLLRDSRDHAPVSESVVLDKEKLDKLFSFEIVKADTGGGVGYVVPQMHGLGNLQLMEMHPTITRVVARSQRVTGEALVALNVDEAFVEGITPRLEEYFAEGSRYTHQFRGLLRDQDIDNALVSIAARIDRYRTQAEAGRLNDYRHAFEQLFLRARLDDLFSLLDAGHLSVKRQDILETLIKTRAVLEKSSYLKEEGYEWGAAYVLWAHGALQIRAAEDPTLYQENLELNQRMTEYRRIHGDYQEKDVESLVRIANKREDVALAFAFRAQGEGKGARRVIIFGKAHDFYKNFLDLDARGGAQGFSFIQLTDRLDAQYDEEIEKTNPIISPSIKDSR